MGSLLTSTWAPLKVSFNVDHFSWITLCYFVKANLEKRLEGKRESLCENIHPLSRANKSLSQTDSPDSYPSQCSFVPVVGGHGDFPNSGIGYSLHY